MKREPQLFLSKGALGEEWLDSGAAANIDGRTGGIDPDSPFDPQMGRRYISDTINIIDSLTLSA